VARPGSCDQQTINRNQAIALSRATVRGYSLVRNVIIEQVNGADIEFSAVAGPNRTRQRFAARWGDESVMWVSCPTSLSSDAEDPNSVGNAPAVGTSGGMYFDVNYTINQAIIHDTPKWPAGAPLDHLYAPMDVTFQSAALTCSELRSGNCAEATLNLLDDNVVTQGVKLAFGDGATEVPLQAGGIQLFGLPADTPSAVSVAPTRLVLRDVRPEPGGAASLPEIDLLDFTAVEPGVAFRTGARAGRFHLERVAWARLGKAFPYAQLIQAAEVELAGLPAGASQAQGAWARISAYAAALQAGALEQAAATEAEAAMRSVIPSFRLAP
jgi:hypothetical protein